MPVASAARVPDWVVVGVGVLRPLEAVLAERPGRTHGITVAAYS
jgi:hypothetical protein